MLGEPQNTLRFEFQGTGIRRPDFGLVLAERPFYWAGARVVPSCSFGSSSC